MFNKIDQARPLPQIETRNEKLSPWVTLQHRSVTAANGQVDVYHSLAQADYTSIVALTKDRHVVLVRQYRPAVNAYTVETPGGLAEDGEDVQDGILRELWEETGYRAPGAPILLGTTRPDIGRLGNWLHGFFVDNVELDPKATREDGIESFIASAADVCDMIANGQINSALHVWLLTQAALRGHLPELLQAMANQNTEMKI